MTLGARFRARLIVALFLAAWIPPASAAKWPAWATEAMSETCLECFESDDAVVVLEDWRITLRQGERRGSLRRVIHVFSEEGRSAADIVLASGAFRRYDKVQVWVRFPTGEIRKFSDADGTLHGAGQLNMLDETRILRIAPPGLVPGSTVALESSIFRAADWPQDLFVLQKSVPVARTVISVDARSGWGVSAKVVHGLNPGPSVATGEATWTFTDLKALPKGWLGLAPVPPATILALRYTSPRGNSPFETWQSAANWFWEKFRLPQEDSPELRTLRQEIESSEEDHVEVAGRLARSVRYFAVELGWGGYLPRSPATTLERAFGDCKDKTQVMLALLNAIDIEAYPVLVVAPSDSYVPQDLPSPELFNHVVAGIPWPAGERCPGRVIVEHPTLGPLRLYDATLAEESALDIGLQLEGGTAFVLHPDTTGVLPIPGSSAEDNVVDEHHRVQIGSDGTVTVRQTFQYHGLLRRYLESDDGTILGRDELRRRVYRRVAGRNPELQDLSIGEVQQRPDGTWSYEFSYRSSGYLSDFGEFKLLELDTLAPLELLPTSHEAGEVVFMPLRATLGSVYDLEYDGWRLVTAVESLQIENSVGRVATSLIDQDSGVRLQRSFSLIADQLAEGDLDEVMELRDALRQANGITLVFQPLNPN